ncbi:DNA protection during starvation protein [compost metagenome]
MKSPIGLDTVQSQALAAELNNLLASYQILYMNVRGFHWNIRGNQFFELHLKFEEIYNDLLLKVDALAERILTLDGVPLHSFSDYIKVSAITEQKGLHDGIKVSAIPEQKGLHDGRACVESLLESFRELLVAQRRILAQAAEAGDEGTASILSDYVQQQEKLVWMLRAYLD